MLQTKFVYGTDMPDLNKNLNLALSDIKSENPAVKYELDRLMAIIEYEVNTEHYKRLCCECKYWDDSGSTSNLMGFCTITGKRCRYNCKACAEFKDIRD